MYERFATEEYVLKQGGVLCPQPNCGAGIIVDIDCDKVTCVNGCGVVFLICNFIIKNLQANCFY